MGKRSDFERKPRDLYPTPLKAFLPLVPFLEEGVLFAEPCAGDGILIKHILENVKDSCCGFACDIKPMAEGILELNALDLTFEEKPPFDQIITNPPWERYILHKMIEKFRNISPTWLLFDSDWSYTRQASQYLKFCSDIVAVGRVSWENNGVAGKDNCSWYCFHPEEQTTVFHGLKPKTKRCEITKDLFNAEIDV